MCPPNLHRSDKKAGSATAQKLARTPQPKHPTRSGSLQQQKEEPSDTATTQTPLTTSGEEEQKQQPTATSEPLRTSSTQKPAPTSTTQTSTSTQPSGQTSFYSDAIAHSNLATFVYGFYSLHEEAYKLGVTDAERLGEENEDEKEASLSQLSKLQPLAIMRQEAQTYSQASAASLTSRVFSTDIDSQTSKYNEVWALKTVELRQYKTHFSTKVRVLQKLPISSRKTRDTISAKSISPIKLLEVSPVSLIVDAYPPALGNELLFQFIRYATRNQIASVHSRKAEEEIQILSANFTRMLSYYFTRLFRLLRPVTVSVLSRDNLIVKGPQGALSITPALFYSFLQLLQQWLGRSHGRKAPVSGGGSHGGGYTSGGWVSGSEGSGWVGGQGIRQLSWSGGTNGGGSGSGGGGDRDREGDDREQPTGEESSSESQTDDEEKEIPGATGPRKKKKKRKRQQFKNKFIFELPPVDATAYMPFLNPCEQNLVPEFQTDLSPLEQAQHLFPDQPIQEEEAQDGATDTAPQQVSQKRFNPIPELVLSQQWTNVGIEVVCQSKSYTPHANNEDATDVGASVGTIAPCETGGDGEGHAEQGMAVLDHTLRQAQEPEQLSNIPLGFFQTTQSDPVEKLSACNVSHPSPEDSASPPLSDGEDSGKESDHERNDELVTGARERQRSRDRKPRATEEQDAVPGGSSQAAVQSTLPFHQQVSLSGEAFNPIVNGEAVSPNAREDSEEEEGEEREMTVMVRTKVTVLAEGLSRTLSSALNHYPLIITHIH